MQEIDYTLSTEKSPFSFSNKVGRVFWGISYWILFRPFSFDIFREWRSSVLKAFGAKIGSGTNVRTTVKIWAQWNMEIGKSTSIGPGVDFYNQGKIVIGDETIISQKTYLCASSHDFRLKNFPLVRKPITIGDKVWIAADSFIGPGASIATGAVVGARAAVFKNIEAWTVVGGNPATYIKKREILP